MSFRSTRVHLWVAAFAVGICTAIGCASETSSTTDADTKNTPPLQGSSSGTPAAGFDSAADAAVRPTTPYLGNPLCGGDASGSGVGTPVCKPDESSSYEKTQPSDGCPTTLTDNTPTAPDAGVSPPPLSASGCRIARNTKTNVIAPMICPCLAAPAGGDGASCDVGADCAPGLACVAGEKGAKTCRYYCCGGSCSDKLSNGGATFCDVQSLVDVPAKAPVCMPLKHCNKLLGTGECSATESCTVVTEGGDTGCVSVGDRQVGQSCDDAHCAATLTCLGQPGVRKCFKLCKVSATDCPRSQTCVTSAAFHDADYGFCQ